MKKFIVSVLNHLGFGVNGVMPSNSSIFAGRLNDYCKEMEVSVYEEDERHASMHIKGGEETFSIVFDFTEDTRRITNVLVIG